MILGFGTDIVEIERIRGVYSRLGERFIQEILLPEEWAYCSKFQDPSACLAARFAAKEAVAKAFGTGIGGQLDWLHIQVTRSTEGVPGVELLGKGKQLAEKRGVRKIWVSLTHERSYASASVILED